MVLQLCKCVQFYVPENEAMIIPVFIKCAEDHIDGEKLVPVSVSDPGDDCVIFFQFVSG